MRYAILFVLLSGCTPSAIAQIDRPGIIAEIAVRTACILFDQPDAPPAPQDGCETGCQCAGTGKEKTGDGLSVVSCRCDDDCDCKANGDPMPQESSAIEQPQQQYEDPPLVPIESNTSSGKMECKNGTCYWIDNRTGRRFRVIR